MAYALSTQRPQNESDTKYQWSDRLEVLVMLRKAIVVLFFWLTNGSLLVVAPIVFLLVQEEGFWVPIYGVGAVMLGNVLFFLLMILPIQLGSLQGSGAGNNMPVSTTFIGAVVVSIIFAWSIAGILFFQYITDNFSSIPLLIFSFICIGVVPQRALNEVHLWKPSYPLSSLLIVHIATLAAMVSLYQGVNLYQLAPYVVPVFFAATFIQLIHHQELAWITMNSSLKPVHWASGRIMNPVSLWYDENKDPDNFLTQAKLEKNNLHNPVYAKFNAAIEASFWNSFSLGLLAIIVCLIIEQVEGAKALLLAYWAFILAISSTGFAPIMASRAQSADVFVGWDFSDREETNVFVSNFVQETANRLLPSFCAVSLIPPPRKLNEKSRDVQGFLDDSPVPFMYRVIDDRQWKVSVNWLLRNSKIAVFDCRYGISDNLMWEIATAIELLSPKHVIAVVTPESAGLPADVQQAGVILIHQDQGKAMLAEKVLDAVEQLIEPDITKEVRRANILDMAQMIRTFSGLAGFSALIFAVYGLVVLEYAHIKNLW